MDLQLHAVLLLVHAAATLAMTGLIWFVQVVHYPLMASVGGQGYREYQNAHMRRTTWVVAPLMLLEAGSALAVVIWPQQLPLAQVALGLGLLGAVWGSTAALQVPAHGKLVEGFDAAAHRRLVGTNWIRVVAWTARSGLALAWLA